MMRRLVNETLRLVVATVVMDLTHPEKWVRKHGRRLAREAGGKDEGEVAALCDRYVETLYATSARYARAMNWAAAEAGEELATVLLAYKTALREHLLQSSTGGGEAGRDDLQPPLLHWGVNALWWAFGPLVMDTTHPDEWIRRSAEKLAVPAVGKDEGEITELCTAYVDLQFAMNARFRRSVRWVAPRAGKTPDLVLLSYKVELRKRMLQSSPGREAAMPSPGRSLLRWALAPLVIDLTHPGEWARETARRVVRIGEVVGERGLGDLGEAHVDLLFATNARFRRTIQWKAANQHVRPEEVLLVYRRMLREHLLPSDGCAAGSPPS